MRAHECAKEGAWDAVVGCPILIDCRAQAALFLTIGNEHVELWWAAVEGPIEESMSTTTYAVTGAYSYSGKHIARRLLDAGHKVITLTQSPDKPNPFGEAVPAFPFHFDDPDALASVLADYQVAVLVNTYWVRFNHRDFTFGMAVE